VQPAENIQVLRHWGRMLGHGAVSAGPEGVVDVLVVKEPAGEEVGEDGGVETTPDGEEVAVSVCAQRVQVVMVEVMRIVDTVVPTSRLVVPPVVWVEVNGQTVVVVSTTTVVITSVGVVVEP